MIQGVAAWPGVPPGAFYSCSYTCSHGTAPGVASLVVPFGLNPGRSGDLVIGDGERAVTVKDCRLASASVAAGAGRRAWSLTIQDRRWRWQYPTVAAHWNRRDERGRVVVDRTFRDLDAIFAHLFGALGVGDYDVSKVPRPSRLEEFPEVNWDYVPAAYALEELAGRLGCVVVYDPVGDRVLVTPPGEGAELSGQIPATYASAQIAVAPGAGALRLVGEEALYQAAFALEPVGVEPDGRVVPVEQLSYKPPGGWDESVPPYFEQITVPTGPGQAGFRLLLPGLTVSELTREEYQALARQSVWRWYRVTLKRPDGGEGDFEVPGYGALESIDQVVLTPSLVEPEPDENGNPVVNPARVHGSYFAGQIRAGVNTEKKEQVRVPFTIDPTRGLVQFSEYVFRVAQNDALPAAVGGGGAVRSYRVGPADLVLVCSVMIRDPDSNHVLRSAREKDLGREGPRAELRGAVRYVSAARYDPETWAVTERRDNRADFEAEADYYLAAEAKRLSDVHSGSARYKGVWPVRPDGAVAQVTWEVGEPGGAFTTVSRNGEHASWLPPFERRRGNKRLKAFFDIEGLKLGARAAERAGRVNGFVGGG